MPELFYDVSFAGWAYRIDGEAPWLPERITGNFRHIQSFGPAYVLDNGEGQQWLVTHPPRLPEAEAEAA